MKQLYRFSILLGIILFVYIYFFNFDNMSETELVNSVLYWYIPLLFGMYGVMAIRIKRGVQEHESTVFKYLFSGKDVTLTIFAVILALTGVLGLLLLFIPLSLVKVQSEKYDISVSFVGTIICLVLLWLFFNIVWPSL